MPLSKKHSGLGVSVEGLCDQSVLAGHHREITVTSFSVQSQSLISSEGHEIHRSEKIFFLTHESKSM